MNGYGTGVEARGKQSRLLGRNALIFGVSHEVAHRVAQSLVKQRVFVVATDTAETALFGMARQDSHHIETLSLADGIEERAAELAHAWRDQPLDLLVLAPFHDLRDSEWRRFVERRLVQFAPALRPSGGRALCLFDPRRLDRETPAILRAEQMANGSLLSEIAEREGITLNALSLREDFDPSDAAARATLLLSPVADGISGAMLPFGAHQGAPVY